MTSLQTIDLLLRGAALPPLAGCAWLLATQRRGDHLGAVGAAFMLAVAAFVLTSSAPVVRVLGGLAVPLAALCVVKPVLFALFARGLFDDGLRLRVPHLVLLAAAAGAGLWHEYAYRPEVWAGRAGAAAHAAAALYHAAIATGIGATLLHVLLERRSDLVEPRRRLRAVFVAVAGGYLALVAAVQLAVLWAAQGATPAALVLANDALIVLGALLACAWLLRAGPLVAGRAGAAASAAPDPALERLRAHLLREPEWFREPGLSVAAFAERLGLHEYQLRRAINQGLGQRNFNQFVNAHRIAWACERLRAVPGEAVLEVAHAAGFASLGPFNREFRARTGLTPSAFRRAGSTIPESAGPVAESARPQHGT